MTPRLHRLLFMLAGGLTLLAVACGGSTSASQSSGVTIATVGHTPTTAAVAALEQATPTAAPSATATETAEATATEPPPTETPAATGTVTFSPAQVPQGGWTVVYLTASATSATLHFRDLDYPMLDSGDYWWAIVGVGAFTDPGSYTATITYTPTDGTEATIVSADIPVVHRDYPVVDIELDPAATALLDPSIVNAELAQRASIYSGYTMQRYWDGAFIAPSDAPLSSVYGEARSYNHGPVTDYHRGTDFAGQTGDPVVAAQRGKVVFTGELKVRGNSVIIDHGAGVFTAYHHLSEIDVQQGQMVDAGDFIGKIGATGLVTGPHLHWEVIIRGVEIDGELWIAAGAILP